MLPLKTLLILTPLALFSPQAQALNLGDGSDGVCVWNNITLSDTLYQCLSLEVTGTVTFDGNDVVVIRVQEDILIDGTMDLSGTDRDPGPGGFLGGLGGNGSGGNGEAPAGFLTARGRGGNASSPVVVGDCYGAGGSGGRHSSSDTPTDGEGLSNGLCDPDPVQGGPAATGSYGDPEDFHTAIRGGAGGGAGGAGTDNVDVWNGGHGGGGGGALQIFAGEDITLSSISTITVNGADGLSTLDGGGGGGGGAGGAIHLSTLGQIIIDAGASLSALGGLGGTSLEGGDGSDGGFGHIRLEDDDGIIPGASAASSPTPSLGLNPIAANPPGSPSGGIEQLNLISDIQTGCALREVPQDSRGLPLLIFFVLLIGIIGLVKSKVNEPSRTRSPY